MAMAASLYDKHLELFRLIWLNAKMNLKEARGAEQALRSIVNHIEKFQDIERFQEYIQQTSHKDRLVLIVSGQLGKEVVPSIHKLRQIIAIYVFCFDKKTHEQWASKFPKVRL